MTSREPEVCWTSTRCTPLSSPGTQCQASCPTVPSTPVWSHPGTWSMGESREHLSLKGRDLPPIKEVEEEAEVEPEEEGEGKAGDEERKNEALHSVIKISNVVCEIFIQIYDN